MSKEIDERADLVARHLFLETSLPPGYCASIGLLVRDGMARQEVGGRVQRSTIVDAQLQLPASGFRTADDVANFCADIIEAEAPEAAARLRGFFR